MPMVYEIVPGAIQTTNAVGNVANDTTFVRVGATRTVGVRKMMFQGRGNALTAVSGLSFRLEKWTTTGSTSVGSTAVTPTPADPGMQAAKAAAGFNAGTLATPGTGGPTLMLSSGCSSTGPGGWQALDRDETKVLEAAATQSLDVWSVCAAASRDFEMSLGIEE